MQHFDGDYVSQLMTRLRAIPGDAVPKWGQLRRDTLIEHLTWALKHAMGRSRQIPFYGNFLTTRIVGPLFIAGFLPIPRNMKFPAKVMSQGATLREPGDLESFGALAEEYLALVQAGELDPAPHQAFGHIGVDGWDQVHVRHFEHHLRQFGV